MNDGDDVIDSEDTIVSKRTDVLDDETRRSREGVKEQLISTMKFKRTAAWARQA